MHEKIAFQNVCIRCVTLNVTQVLELPLAYLGWQWRNFFISYLCQLFSGQCVGQALL